MSTDARAAEAAGTTATIHFRGHSFTISTQYPDWSLDLVESIEEGKSAGIIRGALGPEGWMVVKQLDLKMREVDELAALIASALGFGSVGESAPSGG